MNGNRENSYSLEKSEVRTLSREALYSLANGEKVSFKELENSVLVFNFILGSWCPLCMKHLVDLTKVLLGIGKKDFKMVGVTTESEKSLRKSLEKVIKNGFKSKNILFIPGASKALLNVFSVRLPVFGFSKPATLLIENLSSVRVLSKGIPNNEKIVCDLETYFE
jgi:thiol-disulfide isomerase/thioredoxin